MNNRTYTYLDSNLRFLRESAQLTKGELCSVIGTSNSEIGHLERNLIAKPNYFLLEALADYFGVNTEYLVREDLTLREPLELQIQSALYNLQQLDHKDFENYIIACNNLTKLLAQKKIFDYRRRIIKSAPPRR